MRKNIVTQTKTKKAVCDQLRFIFLITGNCATIVYHIWAHTESHTRSPTPELVWYMKCSDKKTFHTARKYKSSMLGPGLRQ